MQAWEPGIFVRSLAGHDKGTLYVVLTVEEKSVWVSDGKHHPIDRPKRKNRLHVQPDFSGTGVDPTAFPHDPAACSAAIRKAIRQKEKEEEADVQG